MKIFRKTSALSFYLLKSGFQAFKARIKEELDATGTVNLDDIIDDEELRAFYRRGESPAFVAAALCSAGIDD